MNRSGLLAGTWACLLGLAVASCNHQAADSSLATPPAASAAASPTKPAISADDTTWGNYLAAQGHIHVKDVSMHPYIYVIPGGDSPQADTRRQEESDSISHAVGPILIPGGLLIIGGPSAQQTSAFITALSKQLKADALRGIVVLVVSEASQEKVVQGALKPTGATIRFVAF
ncbi:hypothetical protein HDE76_000226 [Rhodanobacter sp. ANJX3]|uniref:hypothetical protein n=1 Tax=unclassified Rhodanobacter TaxID=2621553 RepID=UPI0017F92976|nr:MULTISPECIES: hypothetical protein [unclassified Rhodanobacter]MBB5357044.1 hypothetical protein [Rhodanobacter sp. ANJX3]NYE27116.1 hypothetical protein [Rhodanobacter sp. K2T2]